MVASSEQVAISVSSMCVPLVTIITVVRNGAATIALTLESVRAQCYLSVEHIIVDGASTDETVEIIKSYHSDHLRWISEPDQGIYDAMNKGISLARGDWLLFLGADDVLADPDVLSDIFQQQELAPYDLVCGGSSYIGGKRCVPRLDWHTKLFNTIHHQAAFYRRSLFNDFRYRLDIPVVADYEMNFLIYSRHQSALLLSRHVAISESYGVSHTSSQFSAQIDSYKIRARYENVFLNGIFLIVGLINLLIANLIKHPPQGVQR
jgi:glycosyltransferase involved in cell wall biosynthesis